MQFLRSVLGSTPTKEALPYELGEQYATCWGSWKHYKGTSKEDGSEVSVFAITGANAQDAKLAPARNSAKRLRTLRHPNVISFVSSVEVEREEGGVMKPTLYIVTEPVSPLPDTLKDLNLKGTQRDEYYSWGLLQIAKAVSFLNNDCKLVHGNVCMTSVVVTRTLDWKLHFFDVLTEFDGGKPDAPDTPMLVNEWLVGTQYKPMEVAKGDWGSVRRGPPYAIDAWGLGCFMQELFSGQKLTRTEELRNTSCIPKSVLPDYQRLLGSQPQRRMNPSKLLDTSEFFQNRLVETFQFLEVLSLKDSVEKDSFFRKLPHSADTLPTPIALKKLLPALASALEFGSAPAPGLQCLLNLGSLLPPEEYNTRVLPCLVKLFGSGDRGIRVSLLQNIESFGPSISPQLVEDQVFTHISTGFSDTSAFMRELTLKAILVLAPKMSQRTLGGPLLKHLSKLQVDEEAAIRTNTTILLGNIARHLNESTRKRVLINAFTVRALRDSFPPARTAGIMALMATRDYYDAGEMATRILPMLVSLTVDSDPEVREKATQASMKFLESVAQTFSTSTKVGEASESGAGSGAGTGLLGWAVSSLTSSSTPAPSKGTTVTSAGTGVRVNGSTPQPQTSSTSTPSTSRPGSGDGWGEVSEDTSASVSSAHVSSHTVTHSSLSSSTATQNGSRYHKEEEEEEDKEGGEDGEGWGDIDTQDSPKSQQQQTITNSSLSRIQAAQKRPVLSTPPISETQKSSIGGVAASKPTLGGVSTGGSSKPAVGRTTGHTPAPGARTGVSRPAAKKAATTSASGHVALPKSSARDLDLDNILGEMEAPVPKIKPSKLGAQRIVR